LASVQNASPFYSPQHLCAYWLAGSWVCANVLLTQRATIASVKPYR
jgi:hypothetical protein